MNSQFPIALHIVGFLAAAGGTPLTSAKMAAVYGTSPVVLRRVLSRLQRAGLVKTQRGVNGGSILARSPEKISLREVFQAVSDDKPCLLYTSDAADDQQPV